MEDVPAKILVPATLMQVSLWWWLPYVDNPKRPNKPAVRLFNYRGPNCNKLNKTHLLSAKISKEFKNTGISTASLVYPYVKLDIEQDEIRKASLIKQETE